MNHFQCRVRTSSHVHVHFLTLGPALRINCTGCVRDLYIEFSGSRASTKRSAANQRRGKDVTAVSCAPLSVSPADGVLDIRSINRAKNRAADLAAL